MSGVLQNIDPPPPHSPAKLYPPAFGAGGGHTRWVERGVGGGGVNILEDARHCSVLYIRKYFMVWITSDLLLINQFPLMPLSFIRRWGLREKALAWRLNRAKAGHTSSCVKGSNHDRHKN